MKSISGVLAICIMAATCAAQSPSSAMQPNTIQVGAEGKFDVAPDTVLVRFEIAAQESTSRAAYERASKAAEQVRQILRSDAIDPGQAHVGVFSITPVYDYRTPQHKLIGYRVSTTVELKLKDFSKAGPIVEQLAGVQTIGDQSVSYTLENIDTAKIKAVQDAFRRARSEAEALAQAGGRSLAELSHASIDSVEQGPVPVMMRPMMAKAAGAEQPPTAEFTPQTVTITAHVSVVFSLH